VNLVYDAQGRVQTVTNGMNKTTTLAYEGPDLASITDPLTRRTQFRTDALGRTLATIAPLGQTTFQDWDNLNRLLSITDALGNSVSFEYDNNGQVLTQRDQKQNPTYFTYHDIGAVKTQQDSFGKVQTDLYDAGLLQRRTDRKGQVSGITYDALGRVKTIGFGATELKPKAYKSTVTLTWDNGNRLTQIDDVVSGTKYTTKRVYDELDRLTQETTPQGEVNYTYDKGNRRKTMTVKNGAPGSQITRPKITYTWDNADRLTQIEQAPGSLNGNASQIIKIGYDNANRRLKTTLANGSTINYDWDDASQLKSIQYKKKNGTAIGDLVYGYDDNGRRTSVTGSLARLNLPAVSVIDTQYDTNNRLKRWAGKEFIYDDNGNLTADGVNSFQWDERNQLGGISLGGSQVAQFKYDAQGRRVSKTAAGATTGFLYGGLTEDNVVQELLGDTKQADLKAMMLSAGVDETLLRESSGQLHSFMPDGNNNTIRLLDNAQAKVVDYTFEPYGRTTADATNANSQQFTGRENDDLTGNGLYYYRARYYMPGCMRFISEDPIGWASGQANNYAYVGGDPIVHLDPEGEWAHVVAGAIIGGISGAIAAAKNPCATWGSVIGAGVVGGVVGAAATFAPVGGTAFAAMAKNGLAAAFGNATGQLLTGGSIDGRQVAAQGVVGAMAGLAGNLTALNTGLGLISETSLGIGTTVATTTGAAVNLAVPVDSGGLRGSPSSGGGPCP
jgi:RHS repeat-associated protein